MRFEQRVRKLEAKARDRLAAAAAKISLPEKPERTMEELCQLDPDTLVRMYRESLGPYEATKTDEYKQLYAHYRRMPLMELVRLYRELKRRYSARQAELQRARAASNAEFIVEMERQADECAQESARYRERLRLEREERERAVEPWGGRAESVPAFGGGRRAVAGRGAAPVTGRMGFAWAIA